jgi:hypothetical protein
VRADAFRAAAEQARQGEVRSLPFLLCSLSLETWLAVRSGRWESLAAAPAAAGAPRARAPGAAGARWVHIGS